MARKKQPAGIAKILRAMRAAEKALAEGQRNCCGNDRTEGDGIEPDTIFFEPLKLLRDAIGDAEFVAAMED